MIVLLPTRFSALAGLMLAACTAAWWLGSSRLVVDHGGNPARVALDALLALLVVRAAATSVVGLRVGALAGWRAGAVAGLGLIAPSWPVVLLAWSASTVSLSRVILGEASLLAASLVIPLVGVGLRRAIGRAELSLVAATAAGIASAAACIALGVRATLVY